MVILLISPIAEVVQVMVQCVCSCRLNSAVFASAEKHQDTQGFSVLPVICLFIGWCTASLVYVQGGPETYIVQLTLQLRLHRCYHLAVIVLYCVQ